MAARISKSQAGQRLNLCFDMFDFGADMMQQKLRREYPEAGEAEIRSRYAAWLHERPGAEDGDGQGRRATWPRRRP